MAKAAVNFEYEWMQDGSLRLRFLDRTDAILGQQIIASEAMEAFFILLSLAYARHVGTAPETLVPRFKGFGIDTSIVASLLESVRVRAGITAEGGVNLEVIEDE